MTSSTKGKRATIVGQGCWMMTSASPDYVFTQTDSKSSFFARKEVRRNGCPVRLVTLPCGCGIEGVKFHLQFGFAASALQEPKEILIDKPILLATLFFEITALKRYAAHLKFKKNSIVRTHSTATSAITSFQAPR